MPVSATQKLFIPFIGDPLLSDNQDIGSEIKLKGVTAMVDKINWAEYPYKPFVRFICGYSKTHFWLLFEVKNDSFRAEAYTDHQAVWEDSCVEFFMAEAEKENSANLPEDEIIYRNFEFNSLGTCLSALGSKLHREFLNPGEMKQILRFPGLKGQNLPMEGEEFNWELTVGIPLDLLGLQPGSSFRANFYKCGDLTRQPHFLSWNSITSESPDFHLPRYFGEAVLVI